MARSTEHERIDALRALFGRPPAGCNVALGIGDDAAVLLPSSLPLVASVDVHVETVHFTRSLLSFEDLGYRATMAALSDLAAMGACASGVLASVCLPGNEPDETLFAIARGQRDAALACGTSIIGGNLSRADAISIATTVLGHAERPVARAGARDRDVVLLGGPVGLAAAGLRVLSRGSPTTAAEETAANAFSRPVARIDLGLRAASSGVSAMIDVSDGLAQDALHIARASGVDVLLDATSLEDETLAALAAALGVSAIEVALHGGEDFALVATTSADAPVPEGMRRIGHCRASASPGVFLVEDGRSRAVEPRGFDHFR